MQTKSKLYLLIIGVLVLSNLAMLYFFFGNKEDGRRGSRNDGHDRMKEFLQKDLGFSQQQLLRFDSLASQHKEKMKVRFDSLRNNKEEQFKILGSYGFSDSIREALARSNSERQKQMELNMLHHFASIRSICNREQMLKFDSLFYKIWQKKKK
jgi:hypothetical protein